MTVARACLCVLVCVAACVVSVALRGAWLIGAALWGYLLNR